MANGAETTAALPSSGSPLPTPWTTTITAQAQAAAIATACPTYGASIAISRTAAENLNFTSLELVDGDVLVDTLQSSIDIHFPSLHTVKAAIWMLASRNYVSFGKLKTMQDLVVQDYNFDSSKGRFNSMLDLLAAGTLTVGNSTMLKNTTLTNVTLAALEPASKLVTISENRQFDSLTLTGAYSGPLTVANNSHSSQVPALSLNLAGLKSVDNVLIEGNQNFTIQDPWIISGDLRIRNNSAVQRVKLDNLATIVGSLEVSSNPDLETLAIPRLAALPDDLRVTNNSRLRTAGEFIALKGVGGSMALEGPFDSIPYLSGFMLIGGSVSVDSRRGLNCDSLSTLLKDRGSLKNGTFSCRSVNETVTTIPVITSDDEHTLSTGGIVGAAVGSIVGVMIVVLLAFCFWRHHRQQKRASEAKLLDQEDEIARHEVNGASMIQEMWSQPTEMPTKIHYPELSTTERPSELSTKRDHAELSPKEKASSLPFDKKRPIVQETVHELPG